MAPLAKKVPDPGLGFIFYVYFVSTKPTALSSCITVMSHVVFE